MRKREFFFPNLEDLIFIFSHNRLGVNAKSRFLRKEIVMD
jgi:hypothetical protein